MKNNEIICFYHSNCTDGTASAAIIKHKYPEAQCYPVNHGDPIEVDVTGKTLFIVDFSFPAEQLSQLKKKAKSIYWYDHHKTSLPVYEKLKWGIIDLKECGASLTWKQEYPDRPLPKIMEYVRDKDLFTWKLPDSRAVAIDLKNEPSVLDPGSATWKKLIDHLNDTEWEKMVVRGEVLLKAQRVTILQAITKGFEVNFHGHRAFAVNWSMEASDIGEHIYKELRYPLAIIFYYNGKNWIFSLRSNQVDVSELALKYGGGGHPGAAGFRQDSMEWLLQLKKTS